MNDFSNNVPEYRLPTIEEILDFSIAHIYNFYTQLDPKERVVKHENIIKGGDELIIKFFLPKKLYESKRLFLPVYWHFTNKYASIQYNNNQKSNIFFWKLKKPLPPREQFKQEIKEKYINYLQANLEKISKYL